MNTSVDIFLKVLILLLVWGVVVGLWAFATNETGRDMERTRLPEWAAKNNLRLIKSQYLLWGGPHFGMSRDSHVFYIMVENGDGKRKCGWLRIAKSVLSFPMEDIEVAWDSERYPQLPRGFGSRQK